MTTDDNDDDRTEADERAQAFAELTGNVERLSDRLSEADVDDEEIQETAHILSSSRGDEEKEVGFRSLDELRERLEVDDEEIEELGFAIADVLEENREEPSYDDRDLETLLTEEDGEDGTEEPRVPFRTTVSDVALVTAETWTRDEEGLQTWIARYSDLRGVGLTKAEALRSLATQMERRNIDVANGTPVSSPIIESPERAGDR